MYMYMKFTCTMYHLRLVHDSDARLYVLLHCVKFMTSKNIQFPAKSFVTKHKDSM